MTSRIKIGLIGFGYWGPNLLRNFSLSPHFEVVAVAEPRADRRQRAGEQYEGLRLHESAEDVVAAPDLDAVVVASPVATHYGFARQALEQGKHVLVEKPLASTVAEGEELAALAERQGLTLLVDHTFLFTGAVQTIRQLCKSGELGRISYYDSMRVNLGLFQPDVNVLWDLGPHDISIMDYILDEVPVHIEASGYCHVNPRVPDIAYLTLHFASDAVAHFNLSWMSPARRCRAQNRPAGLSYRRHLFAARVEPRSTGRYRRALLQSHRRRGSADRRSRPGVARIAHSRTGARRARPQPACRP
jgi:predicted dehydrogenase